MAKTSQFIQLEKELSPYKVTMGEAIESVIDQEVSKYPILVVHQQEIEIGIHLFDHIWSVHISCLEEFVSKQVINVEKIDSFKTIYKSPKKFLCLFVISDLGANFIFMPRANSD